MHCKLDFEELVERYSGPLFRFAMTLSRSSTDAEDLVQETFLTWAEKGHQLQDTAKVKPWLFTTLHRLHLGSQRRVVRFPHVDIDTSEPELPACESDPARAVDAPHLIALLDQIDEQYNAPVALFYLEDCSYLEIAEMLAIPLGTVKSRISRGIAQLKRLVESHPKTRVRSVEGSR